MPHEARRGCPGSRLRTGAHAFWRQHCTYLLREAGASHPGLRAELLLAGLSAEQVRNWVHDQQRTLEQLTRELGEIADDLSQVAPPPPAASR